MQTVGISSADHQTTGKFVYYYDLAVRNDVIVIALKDMNSLSTPAEYGATKLRFLYRKNLQDRRNFPLFLRRIRLSARIFLLCRMVKSLSRTRVFTNLFAETYLSLDSCPLPEMISGVLASSIRIESTSSTMAKLSRTLNRSARVCF